MKSVLSVIFEESYFHSTLYPAPEMHAKFQFEGLCAVIQPDFNKVEKCEKQDGFFLQIIAVFNPSLGLILPSLGLDE